MESGKAQKQLDGSFYYRQNRKCFVFLLQKMH